jgi:glycolate oxidase
VEADTPQARLNGAMADHPALQQLVDALPRDVVTIDPAAMTGHRRDMATFCPAGEPLALVRARTEAEVVTTLAIASEFGIPVVPQGARTGLSGAANAVDGCILLSVERMNRILEIDAGNRIAVVEPGVLNADLSRAVGAQGLFYPPDPASWEISTIGGNVATNAGGLCCVKYGVTRDFILAVKAILPTGEVLRTGRQTMKGVAGYDLLGLLVGSEGTLGVITEVTVALIPAAAAPRTVAAMFPTMRAAGDAVAQVVRSGSVPSLLEFMDTTTLRAVNAYRDFGLPTDAAAMLVAQSDAGSRADAEIEMLAQVFHDAGASEVLVAEDAEEGDLMLAARRSVHFALERLGSALIDDVCVPRTKLADFVAGVEKIAADVALTIAVVGHAGDGNTHSSVIFDASDPDQVTRAAAAFDAIMRLGLGLGGTITGEHGVGLLKRDFLERELGDVSMRLHRAVKQAFDPQGILNPGKVFSTDPDAAHDSASGRR